MSPTVLLMLYMCVLELVSPTIISNQLQVLSLLNNVRNDGLRIEKAAPLRGISLPTYCRTIVGTSLQGVLSRERHVPSHSMIEFVLDDLGCPVFLIPFNNCSSEMASLFVHESSCPSIRLNCSSKIGITLRGALKPIPSADYRYFMSLMIDEHPHLNDYQYDSTSSLLRLHPFDIHLSADRDKTAHEISLPHYSRSSIDEVAASSSALFMSLNAKYAVELRHLCKLHLSLTILPDEAAIVAMDKTGFVLHASYAGWPVRDVNNNPHIFIPFQGPIDNEEDALSEVFKLCIEATKPAK